MLAYSSSAAFSSPSVCTSTIRTLLAFQVGDGGRKKREAILHPFSSFRFLYDCAFVTEVGESFGITSSRILDVEFYAYCNIKICLIGKGKKYILMDILTTNALLFPTVSSPSSCMEV